MELTVSQPSDSGGCATLIRTRVLDACRAALAAGEGWVSQNRWRSQGVRATPPPVPVRVSENRESVEGGR
jgi:hypothetical protein